jgi:hypothetical protein
MISGKNSSSDEVVVETLAMKTMRTVMLAVMSKCVQFHLHASGFVL